MISRERIPPGPRRYLVVGIATGALAGMAAFAYGTVSFLPALVPDATPTVLLVLAGLYTVALTDSLADSIRALLVAFAVAIVVVTLASVAPAWLLGPTVTGGDVAIVYYLQQAVRAVLAGLMIVFLTAYFTAVIVAGLLGW